MTTTAITAPDNDVTAKVNDRMTALLDKLVARRTIHHANLAIAIAISRGDGQRRHSATFLAQVRDA